MTKKIKSQTTEKRTKKRVLIFFFLVFVVLFGSVATAVLIPYLNTLPIYISSSFVYTTDLLNDSSSLDVNNRFVLSTGSNEELVFSSTQEHINIGDYNDKHYLFCDKDAETSNVNISFSISEVEVKDVTFKIFICNEYGTKTKELDKSTFVILEEDNIYKTTIDSDNNIFINSVTVSFKKRVK